jgi:lipoprotein-anchoring transpeptidase ErfK/SrfK
MSRRALFVAICLAFLVAIAVTAFQRLDTGARQDNVGRADASLAAGARRHDVRHADSSLAAGARRHDRVGAEASFAAAAAALPGQTRPAFTVGKPVYLRKDEARSRFAPVVQAVEARAAPRSDAPPVAELTLKTTEGTSNIVLVIGETRRAGAFWVHVRLPVLPNGRTGWVPRRALGGYRFVHTRLVVDRARLTAVLNYDGRPIFHAAIGIGQANAPTPSGKFYVRDKLTHFKNPFYGPVAYGTSARSTVLTDWPDGGMVGIHGTNEPGLIPGRVSHGCIRMRNRDILRLSQLMPVGTPLTIR